MKAPLTVSLAVEGPSDEPVIRRLVTDHAFEVQQVLGLKGKGYLDTKLAAYNAAARHGAWLVVRDLDQDAECGAELARELLPKPSKGMRFRIAVRAVEAWLLADAAGVARYFRVPRHSVPLDPDALKDPKRALVDMCRGSKVRAIREDMVPAEGTTARVGPGYVARIGEFAAEWSWKDAAKKSDSLNRCVKRLAAWR